MVAAEFPQQLRLGVEHGRQALRADHHRRDAPPPWLARLIDRLGCNARPRNDRDYPPSRVAGPIFHHRPDQARDGRSH
jgi:hypothetical protein